MNKKYKVYVLVLNKKAVYIGFTADIKTRINHHKRSGKEFESYTIIESFENKEDALICERSIIKYASYFIDSLTNKLYQTYKHKKNYL